jgi:hypothetical protein
MFDLLRHPTLPSTLFRQSAGNALILIFGPAKPPTGSLSIIQDLDLNHLHLA